MYPRKRVNTRTKRFHFAGNRIPLVDKFIRDPSKPLLKSLNANINHVVGRRERAAQFATLKTWPLCQFNPKFPRKHIFQLITHNPTLLPNLPPAHSYPELVNQGEVLPQEFPLVPEKFMDDKYDCFTNSPETEKERRFTFRWKLITSTGRVLSLLISHLLP